MWCVLIKYAVLAHDYLASTLGVARNAGTKTRMHYV